MGRYERGFAMVCRRVITIALLGALSLGSLACTRNVEGDARADPAAVATVHDETQIRSLIDQQNTYAANLDFAKLSETKCAKYRDATANQSGPPVPPMSDLAPPDLLSKPGFADVLRTKLTEKFPSASPEVIGALVDSVVSQNDQAYQTAIRNLFKSLITVKITKVENIEIKGDQATADVTTTTTAAGEQPQVSVETNKYVKEGGKWLDCAPPAGS